MSGAGAGQNIGGASGIWGAGFQLAGCVLSNGVMLSGGDVAGLHVSWDGLTLHTANRGRYSTQHLKIAAIVEDPFNPGSALVWSCNYTKAQGPAAAHSQLWYVTPNTATQTLTSIEIGDDLHTLGAWNPTRTDGSDFSRVTGKQMVCDPYVKNRLYVATYDGPQVITNNGAGNWNGTCAVASIGGLSGNTKPNVCHGIVMDPTSSALHTALYVAIGVDSGVITAVNNPGVYRVTDVEPGGAPGNTIVSGGPASPLGIDAVNEGGGTVLYVAAGSAVKKYNGAWSDISPGSTQKWTAIDAVRVGSATTVVVATNGAHGQANTNCAWSTSGGSTGSWSTADRATGATNNVTLKVPQGGALGAAWWLPSQAPSYAISGGGWDASTICISPLDPKVFYVFGRSGIWRLNLNAGEPYGNKWIPVVAGLCATEAYNVVVDPNNPQYVVEGDTDWTLLYSNQQFHSQPTMSAPSNGDARGLSFRSDSLLSVGLHNRDGATVGSYFTNKSLNAGGSWKNQALNSANSGSFGVLGVMASLDGSGNNVYLAICDGTSTYQGLWRKVTNPADTVVVTPWTRVNTAVGNDGNGCHRQRIIDCGSGQYAMLDLNAGLFISTNYGALWTSIVGTGSLTGGQYAGDLDADSVTPTTLWYTNGDNTVHRVTSAFGGSPVVADVTAPGMNAPSALYCGPGYVLVADNPANNSTPSALWFCNTPTASAASVQANWTDRSSYAWQSGGLFCYSLAVSGEWVYGACNGIGMTMTKFT